MKSKLIRIRNVCLLTGRHHIGEQQFRLTPDVVTAERFGVILMWDDSRFPFLKLKLSAGGSEIPRGREGFAELALQLRLPAAMQSPPRGLGWCCLATRNEALTISGYVDTNDATLYELVRQITGDFQDQNQVITLPIPGVIVAGQESEQLEFEIALMPPEAELHNGKRYYGYCAAPYEGYVGLDLGNHNSTIAAYTLQGGHPEDGQADPEQAWILREPVSNHENASLHSDAPAISSAVCYRSIAGDAVTDALGSVTFFVGRQADHSARASMDGVELAAKRLIASPYYQANKEYAVQKTGSGANPNQQDLHEVGIPRRVAGELLASRLLHLFREATRKQPTRVAVSYPTTFSEREVNQLREVVYRGWLRMFPRPQNDQNLKVLKRDFSGPARLAADSEGILFMLDEASAAAFFFLFNKILRAAGQLSRFRYLYPQGLNLLLCDCGGGTTDIALVRALVRPNDVRKLVLTVRGRVGHRSFGGDYITECVHRILKAKVAARLSMELMERALPGFPQNGSREVITAYFSQHGKEIDTLVPTRFRRSEPGMVHSLESQEKQRRSFALWRIAEDVKRELAAPSTDKNPKGSLADKSVKIPSVVWEELKIPGVDESVRDSLENLTITRREVDALVEGRLGEILDVCNALIRKKLVEKVHTGLTEEHDDPEEVHWVVAAGAACRYPLIPEMLRQKLNVPFLNSTDEEFRNSRMTIDDANLKHAVAKGLAKVLMIADMHDIQVEFDSDLSRRLPFEIVYRDRIGSRRTLFRENAHFDTLTDSQALIPEVEAVPVSADADSTPGHYVLLYRRFPGETRDTPYLKYFFRFGVDGELKVKYDPDAGSSRTSVSPFVMVNENTQEQGECQDLSPEELFLHPVQRGDL